MDPDSDWIQNWIGSGFGLDPNSDWIRSGIGLDPDLDWIRILSLRILIRIWFANPDSDPEDGKNDQEKKLHVLEAKGLSLSFKVFHEGLRTNLLQFLCCEFPIFVIKNLNLDPDLKSPKSLEPKSEFNKYGSETLP